MRGIKKFPFSVHFIWHSDDKDNAEKIIEKIQEYLLKKKSDYFSGCHDFPFFFYSSVCDDVVPSLPNCDLSECNLIFVFCSENLKTSKKWNSVLNIKESSSSHVIPVALTPKGLGSLKNLKSVNAIRIYDFPKNEIEFATLSMLHEIYRFVTNVNVSKGKDCSIKIFLSHTKKDEIGVSLAESVKSLIEKTNISHFFDVTEICPGYKFDKEITSHLMQSTVLAILTDNYSSRYWCQREILFAKENERPILIVDALENCEDRLFPAAANVPCIHFTVGTKITEAYILRILSAAIVESVRCVYLKKMMEFFKNEKWIPKNCKIMVRPPEIHSTLQLNKDKMVCYPEPSLYREELKWLMDNGVSVITPYYIPKKIKSINVGLSISNSVRNEEAFYSEHHLPLTSLDKLSQIMARQLLLNGVNLIYGGDFRRNGFTEIILNEIHGMLDKVQTKNIRLVNYSAWPLYNKDVDKQWLADNTDVLKIKDVSCSKVPNSMEKKFIKPNSALNKSYWSLSLSNMRRKMIGKCDARICAGGKIKEYNGSMPGVLEEIMIALEMGKPIFLIGAFGGVVQKVCSTILNKKIAPELTYSWQESNNLCYKELQEILGKECADYDKVNSTLTNLKVSDLAQMTGLSKNEYVRLMESPFIDEIVHLVLKGLSNI